MGYVLFVGVLPALSTGIAAAFLARAFRTPGRPDPRRVLGAGALLLATGLWVFATAGGGGYSPLAAVHELIVAWVTALVGAFVPVLKPPVAHRIAALLLVTAYPLILFGLAVAGSMLGSDATHSAR